MNHEGSSSLELSDTTPQEKLERALRLSQQVRDATMSDVRRQHPGATEKTLAVAFLRRVYGEEIADRFAARPTAP